jgi:hypothetical protein
MVLDPYYHSSWQAKMDLQQRNGIKGVSQSKIVLGGSVGKSPQESDDDTLMVGQYLGTNNCVLCLETRPTTNSE